MLGSSGNLLHGVVELPGIGCGLSLEVLMLREDDTGSLGQAAGFSGRYGEWFDGTMSGPGCTMVLPGPQEAARCHSQYCECLYKPHQTEGRSQKSEKEPAEMIAAPALPFQLFSMSAFQLLT